MTTIQLILALATKYDLKLRMVNVKGAYLNEKLDDTVYRQWPKGFIKKKKSCLQVKQKCLWTQAIRMSVAWKYENRNGENWLYTQKSRPYDVYSTC